MGPICPKTSVSNCQSTQRNTPEEVLIYDAEEAWNHARCPAFHRQDNNVLLTKKSIPPCRVYAAQFRRWQGCLHSTQLQTSVSI